MSRRSLRIVFLGTADFAVPSLFALVEAGHEMLAVVTQPDKPSGRGRLLTPPPVKTAAIARGLPVLQPRRVRQETFVTQMRDLRPDVLALAAFGQIVPQALLDLPPLGPINVHGSLLPRYRGAAPIQRAIMAGETETGVTTMWMDATLDTGDILLARSLPILPEDNAGTMFEKLSEVGADLLVETLDGLAAGSIVRKPQDDSLATFAPALATNDGLVRWTETAAAAWNRIRGVTPRPGAFATFQGRRIKIWAAEPIESVGGAPGEMLRIDKRPPGIVVACGDGALRITELQPESAKRMTADSWARGNRLAPGARFEILTP
ncbi:MAG TPA: methionyl-tRNA formyltransferase [Chthonomonadaceae bacterium]|nr:methionyl-tRNA formyltransferase [Chthonomonadaceae bacterium]